MYLELVQVMRFESFRKGDYIYKHGDYADKFFILLKGRASILMPKAVLDEQEKKARELREAQ